MAGSRTRGLYALIFLVFIFFILFLMFAFVTISSLKSDEFSSVIVPDSRSEARPIGVVEISGVIMESKKIVKLLHRAEKDKKTKAIILRVNSPGGAVGPTQEIYEEIVRIDKDVKPVFASFGSIAASGGYYVGAATRKIFSNAGTLTGSIGVIMSFMDLSELYQWAKVRPETIKAGKYKDIGSPNRSMSTEERRMMEEMIAKVHDQFKQDIAVRRKDKIVGDLNDHAQGQIFSGQEAKALGLVDEVAGLYAAGRKIHKELKLKEDFGLYFFKEKKKFKIVDLVENIEETSSVIANFFANKNIPLFMSQMRESN